MRKNGVLDKDLKPAFLMLSSCETELSRRTKGLSGEDTAISRGHSQRSWTWLQRVYGNNQDKQQQSALTEVTSRLRAQNCASTPADDTDISNEPTAPMIISKTPIDISAQSAHKRNLEREIDFLHDQLKRVTSHLETARAVKRKLENDYDSERIRRRKVERKLNDVECKLDISQKMENFALDQVKREVDARRRAEDDAGKERMKRKELEAVYEARGDRSIFENLGDV